MILVSGVQHDDLIFICIAAYSIGQKKLNLVWFTDNIKPQVRVMCAV